MEPYFPLGLNKVKVSGSVLKYAAKYKLKKKAEKLSGGLKCGRETFSLGDVLDEIHNNVHIFNQTAATLVGINQKEAPTPHIIKSLIHIIPLEYFGTPYNRKIFMFIVKRILTQTRGEYIHKCILFERFVYESIPWLNANHNKKLQLLHINALLLQTVVKPFIKKYYKFFNNFKSREYIVYPKANINSFMDRNLARSVKQGRLTKMIIACKATGKLIFTPKKTISELIHRPIVCSYTNRTDRFTGREWKEERVPSVKKALKCLIAKYKIGGKDNLFLKWKKFLELYPKRKLYAVKLDLLDAFGMADIQQLKYIIEDDKEFLTNSQKTYLVNILDQQYVHVRGRNQVYKWNHGLLQGKALSPILCDLYLSYLTYNRLKQFDKSNFLFHRTVDDILFIATCEGQILEFEMAACGISILNETKTRRFLNIRGEDPCIVFCGKLFNLQTRETGTAYVYQPGTELRGRFKLWNWKTKFGRDQPLQFITNAMRFPSVNFYFSTFDLNTIGNTPKTVLRNIFDGMCFVGFKFFYVIDSIDYLFDKAKERCDTVLEGVDFISNTYPRLICKVIRKCKGVHYREIFSYKLIRFLLYKAFIVVLNRRHFKYKETIKELKCRLKSMSIPNFKNDIDIKYFSKLPNCFQNVSMRRKMVQDSSCKF